MKSLKFVLLIIILVIVFLSLNVILNKKMFYSPSEIRRLPIKGGSMKLTMDFANNEKIPSKYTCDGENIAPEIIISEIPIEAQSLVLIVDDPDAPVGTWVHWLLYNIPVSITKIDEKNLPDSVKQGMTDFRRIGWGGPCPPSGTHRYFFKLYAIDKTLDLKEGATKVQLEKAIKDHIIEKSEIIGLYKRG